MRHRIDPASELDRLQRALAAASARAGRGETIDLSGLSDEIEALCEHLAATPGDAARANIGGLVTLRGELDGLETILRRASGELSDRLALIAGPAPASDKP